MYNLFEQKNAQDVLSRLEKLQATTTPQWGKMKVDQMLAHCAIAIDTPFAANMKQHFLGKILGKMAKKSIFSHKPFNKSSPTDPSFIVKDQRNFEKEKTKLIAGIKRLAEAGPNGISNKKTPVFWRFNSSRLVVFNAQAFRPSFKTVWGLILRIRSISSTKTFR